jgi:phosphotransferase system IIB component
MRTAGRTDMTKLRVTFHNFAKAPKNVNSRIKLVATMVQVPSIVAQLFKRMAP